MAVLADKHFISSRTAFTNYLLPGPFILSYSVFVFSFSLFFRCCAVRWIKMAMSSAFERR